MLRLTLEVVPWGDEARKRTIGSLIISRTTLREDPETYDVVAGTDKAGTLGVQTTFKVEDHRYEDGAWVLARRALECLTMPETR